MGTINDGSEKTLAGDLGRLRDRQAGKAELGAATHVDAAEKYRTWQNGTPYDLAVAVEVRPIVWRSLCMKSPTPSGFRDRRR